MFAVIIVVPYAWYAIKINNYARAERPEHEFPSYSQLWISLLGMVVYSLWEKVCKLLNPWIMSVVPTKDSKKEPMSDEERKKIADKIQGHIFDLAIYSVSTVWGFIVCMDKDWLPWYLFGKGEF